MVGRVILSLYSSCAEFGALLVGFPIEASQKRTRQSPDSLIVIKIRGESTISNRSGAGFSTEVILLAAAATAADGADHFSA